MKFDCATFKTVATEFMPLLNFAPNTELVFPVSVKSWLDHCSQQGNWGTGTVNFRGTAEVSVTSADFTAAQLNALGGCTTKQGKPLGATAALPPAPAGAEDVFLDFGGWLNGSQNPPDFTKGDLGYILNYYATYEISLNPHNSQLEAGPIDTVKPDFSDCPAVYIEAEWCGTYTRISNGQNPLETALSDFGPPTVPSQDASPLDPALDKLIAINYYYFYPLTNAPPGTPSSPPQLREGQWETISLYFRFDGRIGSTRPTDLRLMGEPAFAVYSQGISPSGDGKPDVSFQNYPGASLVWPKVSKIPFTNNPQAWVSSGTHRNFFQPTFFNSPNPPDTGDLSGAGTAGGGTLGATGGLIAAAVAVASIVAIVLLAVLVFLLLILFIVLLVAAFNQHTAVPKGTSNDFVPPGGPTAVPPQQGVTLSGGGGFGGGPPPEVVFTPSFINNFDPAGDCAPPAWWNFTGRWGVAVTPSLTSGWDCGSRRLDECGRSRGYWNAVELQKSGLIT